MAVRLRALSAIGFCVALAVAGCAGSTATSVPDPVHIVSGMPSAAAASTPATMAELVAAACSGAAVPGAAPFGGSLHPLYVVQGGDVQRADQQLHSFDSVQAEADRLKAEWSGPLQLVVCVSGQDRMRIESCGQYMNNFGQSYEVVRYRLVALVTIVEAATGKTHGTDTVPGSDPDPCTQTVRSFDLLGGPPDVYRFALTLAGL
jgi:hypothetical protein